MDGLIPAPNVSRRCSNVAVLKNRATLRYNATPHGIATRLLRYATLLHPLMAGAGPDSNPIQHRSYPEQSPRRAAIRRTLTIHGRAHARGKGSLLFSRSLWKRCNARTRRVSLGCCWFRSNRIHVCTGRNRAVALRSRLFGSARKGWRLREPARLMATPMRTVMPIPKAQKKGVSRDSTRDIRKFSHTRSTFLHAKSGT
jgi:hypothetical protein